MATTIDRINKLTRERLDLYRRADNGYRGDPATLGRIAEIALELQGLWDQRRRELSGRRTGIDLLVDRAYERIYGPRYDEAVSPSRVGEPEDGKLRVAA